MEKQRRDDGEIVEVMPTLLACGHPSSGNVDSISFAASSPEGERVRTWRCRECGMVTFDE